MIYFYVLFDIIQIMKKYKLISLTFVFVFGLFLFNTNSTNALMAGCTNSTSGFSIITGKSCIEATPVADIIPVYTSSDPNCVNGYDSTTGFTCGCSAATQWLTNKGEYCGTVQTHICLASGYDSTTGLLCGCSSTSGFSGTTGKPCGVTPPDSTTPTPPDSTTPTPPDSTTPTPPTVSTCLASGYDQNTGLLCGCSSASNFSTTTGISCGLYPLGCNSFLGVSIITGGSCGVNQTNSNTSSSSSSNSSYNPTTGLPYGCSSNSGFSITTGKPCGIYPLGCSSFSGFSVITGISCGVLSPATPPNLTCAVTRTLRRGSKGTDVTSLQTRLGSGLVPDGKFGPKTEVAVKTFQKSVEGLVVDGIVGPKTAAALKLNNTSLTCTITRTLKRGSYGTDVTSLQTRLGSGLVPDGKFGPKTEAAVKAFQKSVPGLVIDGIVGPKTAAALKLGK